MKKFIIIFSFLIVLMFIPIYGRYIEPQLLQTTYLRVGTGNPQLKVVQFSDVHLSQYYTEKDLKRAVDKINHQHPDVVVFTGDLFDNYAQYTGDVDHVIDLLSEIKGSIGKYAVWGNHDYGGGAARSYKTVMEEAGFHIFKNDGITLTLADKKIFIGGLDDGLLGNPSIKNMLSYREEVDYSLVLAHEPDLADGLIDTCTQLVLSGHSHGEQVKLPINLFKHSLSSKYTGGLYYLNSGTKLYVNRGLGTTHLPVRFGAIPEISVFELYF
ncbi:metallophosphoesterase (plasmid) [Lactococcus garvieae]|uniref:metallophosphoesterase n=1 Tax=Lactococcus garvieae TaxID=1363 RepID=UPI0030CE0A2A